VSIQGSEGSAVTPNLSVILSDAVTRQIQRGLTKVMYVKFVANYWCDGSIDDPLQLSGCLYQSFSYACSCCSAPSPSACSHQAQGCFIVAEKLRVQSTGKQSSNICCEPEEQWKSSQEMYLWFIDLSHCSNSHNLDIYNKLIIHNQVSSYLSSSSKVLEA